MCSGLSGQTLLWTQDFASTAPTGWTVVNAGSGNNWSLTATGDPYSGTYHMRYEYNSSYAANTWAFTPGIAMTAGNDYYLTFYQKTASIYFTENLKVTVGNAQTVAAQTTTVLTLASLANTTYAQRTTAYYRPTTSGTYYFAFNCYSEANQWDLYVDYVQAYELVASGPELTLSESSYDFGLAYNVSSNCTPHYFIAQNTGAGTVTIASAPQFTGTDASQFTLIDANTYPIELDATEFAYWGVKFTPSSYGEKTAYLSIVDDISAKGLSFFAAEEIPAATEGVKAASNATAKSVDALPTTTVKNRATNNVSLRGFGVMGVFEDYFETYSHLSGTLNPWTQYDGDVTQTWGLQYNPGSGAVTIVPGYTGSFICLDFSSYSPTPDDSWRPYGGDQYAGCAAANGAVNNDWLISPQLSFQDSPRISFFAKSLAADYYPESFNVLYSTTGNSYTNFAGNYLNSTQPQTVGLDWTLFEYELPAACANTNVYIAIQCVSNDMFMLMIDDFVAGHLAGPALTISDDEWDYGLAFIGASNCTPRVFTATNAGSGTVTITNPPTLEGTDAGQFTLTDANTYPIALDTSESASWTVKFTPTSWGEKDDAYLRIVDDLAKSGLTIYVQDPVSGEGQAVKGPGMVPNADKGNRDDAPKQKANNDIALRGFGVEGLMEDYFEYYSHRDQSFGYWTLHDKDLEPTYGIYIGETEYFAPYTGSFIVFDDQAVPELSGEAWMAYSGDNWVGSFDVATTGVLNDDWMVTPALDFDNDPRVSFFAKSPNTSYNPERFKVYYSLTGDAYSDFTGNYVAGSASTWIEPPTEWTKYEYSIPALANHTGWIAIQCVSDDSWVLQIDDFVAGHRSLYDVDPPIVTEILNVGATSTITVTVTNISASAWSYTGFSDTANWLTYTDASGTINPGDDIQIVLNFNATGLTANSTYTTNLVITTDFGSITVPVTLTVLAATNAIPVNPRMVAQWEDAVGVGIAWDYYNIGSPQGSKFGIPDDLIVELSQETTVFIACATDEQTACTNYLTSIGATLANCKFVNFPTNTYWTRDWGPWHIFHGDSRGREMSLVDFDYNRPRPLDDAAAGYINTYIEANYPTNYDNTLFNAPIIHTGGNIMTDGNGAAMSTNLVRDDNDGDPVYDYTPVTAFNYNDAQIAAIMQDFLGIENYMIFQDPDTNLNTTVDHMDCWSKLLDVDIVMIQRVPDTSDEYQLTENAATDWATRASSYGEHFPYRIHRVDEIPGTSGTNYTNCFIHNRKIYIPHYGGDMTAMDAAAKAAYEAAMPQYEVEGYIAKASDPWLHSDAIHCRINTIWDAEMVHIWHHPLWGSVDAGEDIVLPIEITS
ncbi:MAG: choice-of-anchor J domain-containing protein, partial [Candidatus Cloacimonetes bacterium]|nr:choice-of-anchor J domain-containing protein [Candidatus Cloacimonadota bacterium]